MIASFVALATLGQSMIWAPKGAADEPDADLAFRGSVTTATNDVNLQILAASECLTWFDGKLIYDGPARFTRSFPESQSVHIACAPGKHIVAIQVRNDGVTTRMLEAIPPFLDCSILGAQINWKCQRLPGYEPKVHRISDLLGWIDWCDTRANPSGWQNLAYDDQKWLDPIPTNPQIGEISTTKTHPVLLNDLTISPIASGKFATDYGYERDDITQRFFLDSLDPHDFPPEGVWRRYDLGKVRLGRPKLTLDLPAGSIVEYGMAQELRHGRVDPVASLSGSSTCFFDHFVARGGVQEFMPFSPLGGRFLEVHIKSPRPVKFVHESFLERTYFGEPEGSFTCGDPLLNRIWSAGVETMRSCAEDSFIDCPTRERGEWTGDVSSVAMDINAVAYSDLSLARRALVQAAQCARADGLVSGLEPGDRAYLSTYSAQWVSACLHYWEVSGDISLLEDLKQSAERNLAAFEAKTGPEGVSDSLGWGFVDWGYVRNSGPSDISLDIHYLMALRAMARWETALGDSSNSAHFTSLASKLGRYLESWVVANSRGGWDKVGFHRSALALLSGLVRKDQKASCVKSIESHLMTCFPNDPLGPRLSDPGVSSDRLMTPYFAHFAFAALLENGETEFVLDQYRKCWGWALSKSPTWLEVFDTRWSHCHEWSGCPTWQLSRYFGGLRPRFDLGTRVFELTYKPSSLTSAKATYPLPGSGIVRVSWSRRKFATTMSVHSTHPIKILLGDRQIEVSNDTTFRLP